MILLLLVLEASLENHPCQWLYLMCDILSAAIV